MSNMVNLEPFLNFTESSNLFLSREVEDNLLKFIIQSGAETIEDLAYQDEDDFSWIFHLVKRKKLLKHVKVLNSSNAVHDVSRDYLESSVSVSTSSYERCSALDIHTEDESADFQFPRKMIL